jgi:hypothetical protein
MVPEPEMRRGRIFPFQGHHALVSSLYYDMQDDHWYYQIEYTDLGAGLVQANIRKDKGKWVIAQLKKKT